MAAVWCNRQPNVNSGIYTINHSVNVAFALMLVIIETLKFDRHASVTQQFNQIIGVKLKKLKNSLCTLANFAAITCLCDSCVREKAVD